MEKTILEKRKELMESLVSKTFLEEMGLKGHFRYYLVTSVEQIDDYRWIVNFRYHDFYITENKKHLSFLNSKEKVRFLRENIVDLSIVSQLRGWKEITLEEYHNALLGHLIS